MKRFFRYLYYRFIRLQTTPESLARGMALGLFISTTPTFGLQTGIALIMAAIFRCSKIVTVIAAQLTNALTAPPIYLLTYYLGATILDTPFQKELLKNLSWDSFWELGGTVFSALWVGGVVVGTVLAAIGYFVVIGIDTKAHQKIVRDRLAMERVSRKNDPALQKID